MIYCFYLMNIEILVNVIFVFFLLICYDSFIKLLFINIRIGKYVWNFVNLIVKEMKIVV